MLFYELLTKGSHPFKDFNFLSQFDDAALCGKPIEAITSRGAAPWPDVEELISQCLSAAPEHRPKVCGTFYFNLFFAEIPLYLFT